MLITKFITTAQTILCDSDTQFFMKHKKQKITKYMGNPTMQLCNIPFHAATTQATHRHIVHIPENLGYVNLSFFVQTGNYPL